MTRPMLMLPTESSQQRLKPARPRSRVGESTPTTQRPRSSNSKSNSQHSGRKVRRRFTAASLPSQLRPNRFIRQPEYQLPCAKAGQPEFTERGEFSRAVAREFTGSEDRAAQLAGQLFDAGGTIDGWTNASEIKSIAAADITVEDITDVQCQAEPQPGHDRT